MAHWHGLAKLRIHNDRTLEVMDAVTKLLGDKLRAFKQKICTAFVTKELPREFNARIRREVRKSGQERRQTAKTSQNQDTSRPNEQLEKSSNSSIALTHPTTGKRQLSTPLDQARDSSSVTGRRNKTFNLNTYKIHSLGDYVATIKEYGTTDSYSTEPVCDILSPLSKKKN